MARPRKKKGKSANGVSCGQTGIDAGALSPSQDAIAGGPQKSVEAGSFAGADFAGPRLDLPEGGIARAGARLF